MRKVYIIDSNNPKDYYEGNSDGAIAQQILRALDIQADLRLALDRRHFSKAVIRALRARCDVLHVSAHGDDDGVGLCCDIPGRSDQGIDWQEFVELFQDQGRAPTALIMASCRGASTNLARAFETVARKPRIIIGSTENLPHADYVAAYALLYRRFEWSGIRRSVAQNALEDICAVVHRSFRYLRWDDERGRYRPFPGEGRRFEVTERPS